MHGRFKAMGSLLAGVVLLASTAAPIAAADRDKDGLRDGFETRWGVTDPDVRDTDRDGVIDSAEDNDRDGLGNLGEQRFGTDPGRRDTDRDGTSDAREDKDRDGRSNAREQDQRRVPAGLKPSLSAAVRSFPPIRFRCQTPHGRSWPVTCSFGPKDGSTRVVLIGDSHAMMWSSPIRVVSRKKGWRLTVMTKTACSPVLGIHTAKQLEIDGGKSCQAWRRKVITKLKADPPDLIVITNSDGYKLYSQKGVLKPKTQWPGVWKQGLKRTLAAMPARSRVLVLGDVPHNYDNPQKCLSRHRGDMSACVSPRVHPPSLRIESAWRQAAKAKGAHFRTLSGKICSYQPCPLVQGKILMWRDQSHLTDRFALQLTPSMRAILEGAVPAPARRRR